MTSPSSILHIRTPRHFYHMQTKALWSVYSSTCQNFARKSPISFYSREERAIVPAHTTRTAGLLINQNFPRVKEKTDVNFTLLCLHSKSRKYCTNIKVKKLEIQFKKKSRLVSREVESDLQFYNERIKAWITYSKMKSLHTYQILISLYFN